MNCWAFWNGIKTLLGYIKDMFMVYIKRNGTLHAINRLGNFLKDINPLDYVTLTLDVLKF